MSEVEIVSIVVIEVRTIGSLTAADLGKTVSINHEGVISVGVLKHANHEHRLFSEVTQTSVAIKEKFGLRFLTMDPSTPIQVY
jgi:hypothetical protein